jgi:hypothetical protein
VIPATMPGGKAMESVLGYGCHQRLGYGASHESFAVPPSLLLSKYFKVISNSSCSSVIIKFDNNLAHLLHLGKTLFGL